MRCFTPPTLLSFVVLFGSQPAGAQNRVASGDTIRNERLNLVVETAPDLSSVAISATFHFRTSSASPSGVWFQFPGVDKIGDLARLELNGRKLPFSALRQQTGDGVVRFVLDRSVLYRTGANQLVVVGPSAAHRGDDFTHWAGWHPYLGSHVTPVPISLEVRTGLTFEVVSSGRRVSESIRDGRRVSRWQTGVPQGWVFLSIGKYRTAKLAQAALSMTVYWPRSHPEFRPDSIGRIPFDILHFYRDRFGGEAGRARNQFALIEIPNDEVVNFSVDGLVVISRGSHRNIVRNPSYLEALLAHELAHYWWGAGLVSPVGPGARWLREGFAEFSRDLYERETGKERVPWAYRNLLVLKRFADEAPPPLTALLDTGADEVYYQKGAFVLHMLEAEIGKPHLLEAMRRLVLESRGRAASVNDFVTAVDVASRTSSEWFFDQWLRRATGPELRLSLLGLDRHSDSVIVRVNIDQDAPAYRLRLPITAYFANGDSTIQMVRVDSTRTSLELRYARRPERLVLDPDDEVFKWVPSDAMPLDFLGATKLLHDAPCVRAEGAADSAAMDSLARFLARRFRRELSSERQCPVTILVGDTATRFRERFASAVSAPQSGTLGAFVRRNPGDPHGIVIGVEGSLAASWPDALIPEAPLTSIALRNGQVIAAQAAGLPRIGVSLVGMN
jgi:hypothetical protein